MSRENRHATQTRRGGPVLRVRQRAVRAAGVSEVPALEELWKAMVEHHRCRMADQRALRIRAAAWVCGLSVVPAGPTFDLGEVRGDVDSLVTAEAIRGQGVGSALLNACRDELRGFRPFLRSTLAALDEPS